MDGSGGPVNRRAAGFYFGVLLILIALALGVGLAWYGATAEWARTEAPGAGAPQQTAPAPNAAAPPRPEPPAPATAEGLLEEWSLVVGTPK